MQTDDGQVIFVTWVSAVSRDARRVTLDKDMKIKAIVAYLVPVEDFRLARVLINTVGFPMVKRPKEHRMRMPSWCVLKQWQASVENYSGPYVEDAVSDCGVPSMSQCVACTACSEVEVDQKAALDNLDLQVCSSCLTPWHRACATTVPFTYGMPVDWEDTWQCIVCSGWL